MSAVTGTPRSAARTIRVIAANISAGGRLRPRTPARPRRRAGGRQRREARVGESAGAPRSHGPGSTSALPAPGLVQLPQSAAACQGRPALAGRSRGPKVCGRARVVTANRFQALIAVICAMSCGQLVLVEVRGGPLVDPVGHIPSVSTVTASVSASAACSRSVIQVRASSHAVIRSSLLVLAALAGVRGVHVEAVRAAC